MKKRVSVGDGGLQRALIFDPPQRAERLGGTDAEHVSVPPAAAGRPFPSVKGEGAAADGASRRPAGGRTAVRVFPLYV